MSSFYITTPIYYVNGAPHIGHAYTTIVADVLARHFRQRGDDVFFMTGTDEHGLKVQRAAEEQGMTPKELADLNSSKFRDLFEQMELSHDRFIRTTDDDHRETVLEMVRRMKANGDIYLDSYAGWYAASDEAFYDESEIADGKAISTGATVEWVEEPSYFFRLSAYADKLLDWYDADPAHVQTDGRRNEVRAFVAGGLNDLSITRTTFEWGIPFEDNPEHVLYVWVDALTNYVTGVGGFSDSETFDKFWPCDVHLIGKDILRFHAVYWPAFLMSAGLEPPKQVFAHGWWMNEGEKMSKSLGNFIDAFELVERYPKDVLRYYLVREIPLGSDGNFVHARLAERNNAELADNLGNLVNRSFAMTKKFADGKVADGAESDDSDDAALREGAIAARDEVLALMDARDTSRAIERALSFSSDINQYIAVTQPWKLNKEGATERLEQSLYHQLEALRWVAVMVHAFIPDAADAILTALGETGPDAAQFSTLEWGRLPAGRAVEAPAVLFEKFDIEAAKEESEQAKKAVEAKKEPTMKDEQKDDGGLVSYQDFMKLQIHVGQILAAESIEGADKLLKLSVDVGEDDPRQVVAGVAKSYSPDELVGRRLAVVTNLKPAKIFGIESRAMLLAADREDGGLELTEFPETVAVGTRVS